MSLVALYVAAFTTASALPAPHPLEVHHPAPSVEGLRRMSLWATYYSIPRVRDTRRGVPLLDLEGRALGPKLKVVDFCRAAVAGTVEVRSRRGVRRLYRFEAVAGAGEAQVDCTPHFRGNIAAGRARFSRVRGSGMRLASGTKLAAHRTIAVDPARIPLGSVIFVPAARGTSIVLEDGRTHIHDGYFYAADTGGAIIGDHIDVFLGFSTKNPFAFVRSSKRAKFDAYVLEEPRLTLAAR